ncbi:hypothetical protein AG1IA_01913 [Rhizoctonia solani AG-1 IA]|uniref:Uncharacterized protein n=1 Tax=Thanatephorus cucumeris (strain AG1-IA) TaxID=983506 RepID=L8X5Y9_THACA|nr:hypothetical protein AG1IA_01913 [Rhizoctonia solani AG-1 IA]
MNTGLRGFQSTYVSQASLESILTVCRLPSNQSSHSPCFYSACHSLHLSSRRSHGPAKCAIDDVHSRLGFASFNHRGKQLYGGKAPAELP